MNLRSYTVQELSSPVKRTLNFPKLLNTRESKPTEEFVLYDSSPSQDDAVFRQNNPIGKAALKARF
jgi:hypothetical protein